MNDFAGSLPSVLMNKHEHDAIKTVLCLETDQAPQADQ
jgi:hypothetical protein